MNILGYLFTIGEFLPAMKVGYFSSSRNIFFLLSSPHIIFFLFSSPQDRGSGHIVNISSDSERVAFPGLQFCYTVLFQNVVGKCNQTNFFDTCTLIKYSDKCIQILNHLKQRGSNCLNKYWNIKKGFTVYTGTKFFWAGASDALRKELTGTGVCSKSTFLDFGKFCLF